MAELRDRLSGEGALAAAMTGSGAAVFGLFADEEAASRARAALAPSRAWCVSDLQPAAPRSPPPGVIQCPAALRRAARRPAALRPSSAGA